MARILVLGGTTEARQLAERLGSQPNLTVIVSLAGRTRDIVDQKAPTRIGGFGGVAGLADYLERERIDALIDATHPYAAIISQHAVDAAKATRTPLLALRRPPWTSVDGDTWIAVGNMAQAVDALGSVPRRAFLALGRKELAPFGRAPQHFYLVRSVDPIEPPPLLPDAAYIVARGPFDDAADRSLMATHAINALVCRNSGGAAAYGKITAARSLAVPVIMVRRPPLPLAQTVEAVDAAIAWLDHIGTRSTERGV